MSQFSKFDVRYHTSFAYAVIVLPNQSKVRCRMFLWRALNYLVPCSFSGWLLGMCSWRYLAKPSNRTPMMIYSCLCILIPYFHDQTPSISSRPQIIAAPPEVLNINGGCPRLVAAAKIQCKNKQVDVATTVKVV